MGGMGVTGCSAANDSARRRTWSSCGHRYTDFTTSSKWLFKDNCKFVNINVSEFQALKLDAIPVVADAKDALPRLEKLLEGYKTATPLRSLPPRKSGSRSWKRLDGITFEDKKSWKPIINDANADSAKRFAKDLNAQLCQTTVLGAINAMMDDEDVAIGAAGSLPAICSVCGVPRPWIPITWSTATPPWAMR